MLISVSKMVEEVGEAAGVVGTAGFKQQKRRFVYKNNTQPSVYFMNLIHQINLF